MRWIALPKQHMWPKFQLGSCHPASIRGANVFSCSTLEQLQVTIPSPKNCLGQISKALKNNWDVATAFPPARLLQNIAKKNCCSASLAQGGFSKSSCADSNWTTLQPLLNNVGTCTLGSSSLTHGLPAPSEFPCFCGNSVAVLAQWSHSIWTRRALLHSPSAAAHWSDFSGACGIYLKLA